MSVSYIVTGWNMDFLPSCLEDGAMDPHLCQQQPEKKGHTDRQTDRTRPQYKLCCLLVFCSFACLIGCSVPMKSMSYSNGCSSLKHQGKHVSTSTWK